MAEYCLKMLGVMLCGEPLAESAAEACLAWWERLAETGVHVLLPCCVHVELYRDCRQVGLTQVC
jgi:hypothetical protein